MESHITPKCEKEQMFLEIKENKSYILTPWEFEASMGFLLFVIIKFLQRRFYCRVCVSSGGIYSIKSVRLHSNT